ncbi:MAG: hypothetical protein ACRCTI_15695, partial [Beijerinckiaceae bacterium]
MTLAAQASGRQGTGSTAARMRQLRFFVWSFSRSPTSMIGAALVFIFFLLAAFGPWIAPFPQD